MSAQEIRRSGLPLRAFLYTLDQIAVVLQIEVEKLPDYVDFMGEPGGAVTVSGMRKHRRMRAINVLPTHLHTEPEWRVPEAELIRYMTSKGMVIWEVEADYPA